MIFKLHQENWAVSGGSKRGWTTWLVGSVDPERVNLIVPVVATVVDYKKVMHSWLRNLGGSALAVAGYYVDQIIQNIDHPNFADFGDPMIYKERLTMAKLVIPATMDYFFQITDTWSFFDDLPGEKYLRLLPNSEHSTALSGVSTQHWILTFRNLLLAQMTDYKKSPTMTWTRSSDAGRKTGTIIVTVRFFLISR